MSNLSSDHESPTPAEPQSTTGDKASIGKTHEEFIGDEATPSHDRSEFKQPHPAAEDGSNTIKDPSTWVTGDEPATGAQLSYLKTLASETKYDFDEAKEITKADASKLIDELRQKSSRVQDAN